MRMAPTCASWVLDCLAMPATLLLVVADPLPFKCLAPFATRLRWAWWYGRAWEPTHATQEQLTVSVSYKLIAWSRRAIGMWPITETLPDVVIPPPPVAVPRVAPLVLGTARGGRARRHPQPAGVVKPCGLSP